MTAADLARVMFDAYGAHCDWKAWDGRPMPSWEAVNDAVRSHWEAAAQAALAAHLLYVYGNVSPTGGSASAFQSMRLGPASLTKGKSEWSGNPADAFLDTTAPGSLYLYLRSKYVLPIMCS